MKRVILTDSQTGVTRLFQNPPWRLGRIRQQKGSNNFDVHMIHEDGQEMTINVNADPVSLQNRFKDW